MVLKKGNGAAPNMGAAPFSFQAGHLRTPVMVCSTTLSIIS